MLLRGLRQMSTTAVRSTTASGSTVYESARATDEYLQFHYASPEEILPYDDAPRSGLDFLPRLARTCASAAQPPQGQPRQHGKQPTRALDVGCAVGRASFELSRYFDETVGVDFSHAFVEAAAAMQAGGEAPYEAIVEAHVTAQRVAALPGTTPVMAPAAGDAAAALPPVRPETVSFAQGDACTLDAAQPALQNAATGDGTFDAVLASNLLCRLPAPAEFLARVPALLRPGGVFVLASPYSWLEEYTAKERWLGGYCEDEAAGGLPVGSAATVDALLESHGMELVQRFEAPFVIREHARKFQWGTSDTTVWRMRE